MNANRYIVLLLVALLVGCKNQMTSSIPSTKVDFKFNILTDAPQLNANGGVATFIKPKYANQYLGYGGVVVFRNFEGASFAAFDLACPNEVDPQVRLNVDSIPGEAICMQCGAVFDIAYSRGYPISDNCKSPLRPYSLTVSGYEVHVYN